MRSMKRRSAGEHRRRCAVASRPPGNARRARRSPRPRRRAGGQPQPIVVVDQRAGPDQPGLGERRRANDDPRPEERGRRTPRRARAR